MTLILEDMLYPYYLLKKQPHVTPNARLAEVGCLWLDYTDFNQLPPQKQLTDWTKSLLGSLKQKIGMMDSTLDGG